MSGLATVPGSRLVVRCARCSTLRRAGAHGWLMRPDGLTVQGVPIGLCPTCFGRGALGCDGCDGEQIPDPNDRRPWFAFVDLPVGYAWTPEWRCWDLRCVTDAARRRLARGTVELESLDELLPDAEMAIVRYDAGFDLPLVLAEF